ncbi:MAG: nuclear transport factor 2 family protein [Acidimicrobiales bacterium]|nr:nuclear transport factor 2 family protein [Acidimicrobiales bacterium]
MPTTTQDPTPADHAEIRNLLARYCVALDVDDVDAWVELFTPDAVYEVYGREFVGHEGLRGMATAAPGGLHLGGPVAIDLDGDKARTTRNLLFVERSSGEHRHAVYDEDLVRTDEGWRIARCRCRFHGPDGLADRPPR